MSASNTCWGIELGAGAVKALKLQRDGEELKVLEFAVIPHKKPLSTPDLDQLDAVRVAIGELVSTRDLSNSQIAISIPGHSSFARFAKLPPVEPKKIPDIVKFEAVQQIPFPIDQVEWDYQVFTSQDNPDVEVGIFAVTREKVMEKLAQWQDVNVTPTFVTLGPLAAYNAVAWDQQFGPKTPGTVILDIGTTSTDLIICEPGRVWVRTFPIGGHNFTQALVEQFKLSYPKAEALKRQAEQSKHFRHILQAMRPVFADLAQDVQRSLGYYQSSHRDANLTRLIGLGSTFQLPGLRKYLSQQLQMEVVRLESFAQLSLEGPLAGEFQGATLNLATCYGLCLQGLGFEHGIMANLMPVAVVRQNVWSKKTKWMAVAAGLSLAAGGVSFIRPLTIDAQLGAQPKPAAIDAVVSVRNEAGKLKDEWSEVEKTLLANFEAANVAGLVKERQIHAFLVSDLAKIMEYARQNARATFKGDEAASDATAASVDGAIVLSNFVTKYVPPVSAAANPGGVQPTDPNAPPIRKVQVTFEFATNQKTPIAFVENTVKKWLGDNKERVGVPYVILSAESYKALAPKVIKIEEKDAPRDDWSPGGGAGPGDGPAGDRGGRGGGVVPGRIPGGGAGKPSGGSGVPGDTAQPTGIDPAKAREEINRLAPIPPKPLPGKAGDEIYIFTVSWEVEIRDLNVPKPAEENKT